MAKKAKKAKKAKRATKKRTSAMKRSSASRRAAATRKRNAAKRSRAAKRGAKTRAKHHQEHVRAGKASHKGKKRKSGKQGKKRAGKKGSHWTPPSRWNKLLNSSGVKLSSSTKNGVVHETLSRNGRTIATRKLDYETGEGSFSFARKNPTKKRSSGKRGKRRGKKHSSGVATTKRVANLEKKIHQVDKRTKKLSKRVDHVEHNMAARMRQVMGLPSLRSTSKGIGG